MTDTSDKAIEALAAAPWAYASADLSAMIIALQAERNQLITAADADARVEAAVLAERAACAEILDDKAADHDADASRFRSGSDPHHNRSFLAKTAREHAAAIRSRGVTG